MLHVMDRALKPLALAGILLSALPASADRIDDAVRQAMAEARFPGAVLLISRDGKPVRFAAYGQASLEMPTPVKRNSVFEIGSVSKQFTTAAVLLLVDDKKLALDDPIGKHLPEAPEKWKALTLRQVLSHTSGLKDTLGDMTDPKTRPETYFKTMGNLAFDFEPGTSWSYSNEGFNLAAMVVEKVSNERLPEFLDKRVFQPLKMQHTRFTDPDTVVAERTQGYSWGGKTYTNANVLTPGAALGAGAILSTADDLASWDHALMTGKLLSDASRKEFFTPTKLKSGFTVPYALGWFVNPDQGKPIIEHGGNTFGFSCSNLMLPQEKVSIIVLTNVAGYGATSLTRKIAAIQCPAYDVAARKPTPDPDPKATALLMIAFRKFGNRQYGDLSAFAPSMKGTLSSARGAMMRMGLGSMGKNLITYKHIDSETLTDGRRLSRYLMQVGKGGSTAIGQVTWSMDGKAEEVNFLYRK